MRLLSENQLNELNFVMRFAHVNYYALSQVFYDREARTTIDGVDCYLPINNVYDLVNLVRILDQRIVNSTKKLKFVDLGSGTGNILVTAGCLGYEVFGLEYQKKFVDYSNRIVKEQIFALTNRITNRHVLADGLHRCVTQGNLMNNSDLEEAVCGKDVVYAWNPIAARKEMLEVLAKTIDYMKPGALLVYKPASVGLNTLVYRDFAIYKDLKYDRIDGYEVYVKSKKDKLDTEAFAALDSKKIYRSYDLWTLSSVG